MAKMKFWLRMLVMVLVFATAVVSCDDGTTTGGNESQNPPPIDQNPPAGNIAVTGVSLNKSSTYLVINGTETLYATILPFNASNQNITWSSSDTSVATVSTDGLVTGVRAGRATITVTTVSGGFKDSTVVNVSNYAVSVTGVSLLSSSVSLNPGTAQALP